MMIKLIHYILMLFLLGVITIHKGYAQACTTIVNLLPNGVITLDGLQITTTSQRVYTYSYNLPSPCPVFTMPANAIYLGQNEGLPFLLKLKFSKKITSLVLLISAVNKGESFNFTSNGGAVQISFIDSCYLDIIGSSLHPSPNMSSTGAGVLEISAAQSFSELTISGIGAGNGSLLALCGTSIEVCSASSEPNRTAATQFTETGISDYQGFVNDWPKNIPNGFVAIESRNQGFVITRVRSVNDIPNDDQVEGMLVYDITDACVKLYDGSSWHCIALDCQ